MAPAPARARVQGTTGGAPGPGPALKQWRKGNTVAVAFLTDPPSPQLPVRGPLTLWASDGRGPPQVMGKAHGHFYFLDSSVAGKATWVAGGSRDGPQEQLQGPAQFRSASAKRGVLSSKAAGLSAGAWWPSVRPHPPPPPSPGKAGWCGPPSGVASDHWLPARCPLHTQTPPHTAPSPHPGDAQRIAWTPGVLPALRPFGLPLGKTALCSMHPQREHLASLTNQGAHPAGRSDLLGSGQENSTDLTPRAHPLSRLGC